MLACRHMKLSTGLAVVALVACGGCGGGDSLDATRLAGEWHVAGGAGDTLVIDATNAAAGLASPVSTGQAGALVVDSGAGTIRIGDLVLEASLSSDRLTITRSGTETTYERLPAAEPLTVITVAGQATNAAGAIDTPRVALLAMLRGTGGQGVKFFLVPADVEPAIDVPVSFGAGTSAGFQLARSEGALGVERIAFGTTGFAAVNVLVAYEDRNHDGVLNRFVIDACTATDVDCIRGVAPLVLAERDGDSAELQAAGYDLMRTGWAVSAVVPDARRADGTTIVPLDPTVQLSMDVTFAADPTTAKFPALKF
jgi:hypothetical protein